MCWTWKCILLAENAWMSVLHVFTASYICKCDIYVGKCTYSMTGATISKTCKYRTSFDHWHDICGWKREDVLSDLNLARVKEKNKMTFIAGRCIVFVHMYIFHDTKCMYHTRMVLITRVGKYLWKNCSWFLSRIKNNSNNPLLLALPELLYLFAFQWHLQLVWLIKTCLIVITLLKNKR